MASILYDKYVRPSPFQTHLDDDGSLNVEWPVYDNICRNELLFVCKVLATVFGHSTVEERLGCIHFFRQYGIRCIIRSHMSGTIWKIKYQNELHKFTHLWMRACRGTLIYVEGSISITTSLINCPPVKFFPIDRFEEFYGRTASQILNGQLSQESVSKTTEPSKFKAVEKVDGSLITIYWDGVKITANTLGSFGEAPMQKDRDSYQERALSYITEEISNMIRGKQIYLICELVTSENRIVSKYNREGLCLLYICDKHHHIYPSDVSDFYCSKWSLSSPNWWRPRSYEFTTMEELDKLMSSIEELMPDVETPEGFVIYCDDNIPIAKTKTAKYKELHHNVSINIGTERDLCKIDYLFYTQSPDLQSYCDIHELRQEYLTKLKIKHQELCDEIESLILTWSEIPQSDKNVRGYKAKLVKECINEQWLQRYFFVNDIDEQIDATKLLCSYLTSVSKNDTTQLHSLHQKSGPIASEKTINIDEKKEDVPIVNKEQITKRMAACFDFDGTLVSVDVDNMRKHRRKFVDGRLVSIWDRKASLRYVTPNSKVFKLLNGYIESNIPTYIVTGRKHPIEKKLLKYLNLKDSVKILTCPNICITYSDKKLIIPDVNIAKSFVYSILTTKYKCLVYEDDEKVLKSIQSLGCVGIKVSNGDLCYSDSNVDTHVVGLCGPPGSGKTTILKILCEELQLQGLKVGYISSDVEGSNLPGKLFNELKQSYNILILDMCFSGTSSVKLLEKYKCNYTLFTHIPNKDGVIYKYYRHWCLYNVINRGIHETIPSEDFIHCRDIVSQKCDGVRNVLSKCVQIFPDLYDEIETSMNIENLSLSSSSSKPRKVSAILNKITNQEEIKLVYDNVNNYIPSLDITVNRLKQCVLDSIAKSQVKTKYHGFYYGLAIDPNTLPKIVPIVDSMKPFVPHVTLDITDPLEHQNIEVCSVHKLKTKCLYTDESNSLLALELSNDDLIDNPHISLCWKGKPVDCRHVLETKSAVIVDNIEHELVGYALYLV